MEDNSIQSTALVTHGERSSKYERTIANQEMLENEWGLSVLSAVDVRTCFTDLRAKSISELFELYKRQSNELGFGVHSSTTRGPKGGPITEKYYVCACEGITREKKESPITPVSEQAIIAEPTTKRKRRPKINLVTRTGCKVNIRIKIVNEAYEVIHYVTNHNHAFTRVEWQFMQRSERSITEEKAKVIEGMEEAKVKPSIGFKYMAYQAGGIQGLGHLYKDHLNHVYRLRMQNIEGGDANQVCGKLKQRALEDENFFYRIGYKDENHKLSALFWRDSMMKEDYEIYGDLVIFDTTYRTNKYNLMCAPIVGMNNHGNIVMFGCAFIADEKAETFNGFLRLS